MQVSKKIEHLIRILRKMPFGDARWVLADLNLDPEFDVEIARYISNNILNPIDVIEHLSVEELKKIILPLSVEELALLYTEPSIRENLTLVVGKDTFSKLPKVKNISTWENLTYQVKKNLYKAISQKKVSYNHPSFLFETLDCTNIPTIQNPNPIFFRVLNPLPKKGDGIYLFLYSPKYSGRSIKISFADSNIRYYSKDKKIVESELDENGLYLGKVFPDEKFGVITVLVEIQGVKELFKNIIFASDSNPIFQLRFTSAIKNNSRYQLDFEITSKKEYKENEVIRVIAYCSICGSPIFACISKVSEKKFSINFHNHYSSQGHDQDIYLQFYFKDHQAFLCLPNIETLIPKLKKTIELNDKKEIDFHYPKHKKLLVHITDDILSFEYIPKLLASSQSQSVRFVDFKRSFLPIEISIQEQEIVPLSILNNIGKFFITSKNEISCLLEEINFKDTFLSVFSLGHKPELIYSVHLPIKLQKEKLTTTKVFRNKLQYLPKGSRYESNKYLESSKQDECLLNQKRKFFNSIEELVNFVFHSIIKYPWNNSEQIASKIVGYTYMLDRAVSKEDREILVDNIKMKIEYLVKFRDSKGLFGLYDSSLATPEITYLIRNHLFFLNPLKTKLYELIPDLYNLIDSIESIMQTLPFCKENLLLQYPISKNIESILNLLVYQNEALLSLHPYYSKEYLSLLLLHIIITEKIEILSFKTGNKKIVIEKIKSKGITRFLEIIGYKEIYKKEKTILEKTKVFNPLKILLENSNIDFLNIGTLPNLELIAILPILLELSKSTFQYKDLGNQIEVLSDFTFGIIPEEQKFPSSTERVIDVDRQKIEVGERINILVIQENPIHSIYHIILPDCLDAEPCFGTIISRNRISFTASISKKLELWCRAKQKGKGKINVYIESIYNPKNTNNYKPIDIIVV